MKVRAQIGHLSDSETRGVVRWPPPCAPRQVVQVWGAQVIDADDRVGVAHAHRHHVDGVRCAFHM